MPSPCIYLASQSPRRRKLLEQISVRFDVVEIDVPEHRQAGETPLDYVQRLALDKASAGMCRLREGLVKNDKKSLRYWQSTKKHATIELVIGADTAVVNDGMVLGKPQSASHAASMLRQLSGGTHEVLSGVAVVSHCKILTAISRNLVTFKDLSEQEIARYIATGEGHDKAGGYAIQGMAAIFIEKIQGSYSGVMGLPLYETSNLLAQMGVDILPGA